MLWWRVRILQQKLQMTNPDIYVKGQGQTFLKFISGLAMRNPLSSFLIASHHIWHNECILCISQQRFQTTIIPLESKVKVTRVCCKKGSQNIVIIVMKLTQNLWLVTSVSFHFFWMTVSKFGWRIAYGLKN